MSAGVPSGLAVNTDGSVSGVTCGSNGISRLTVSVTDSVGGTASSTTAALIVNAAPTGGCSLTFSSSTLPAGTMGTAYSASISATGGTSPYTYQVTSGILPAGLTLAANGSVSGTPTTAGSYSFTVLATDSASDNGTQSFTVTISIASSAPVAGAVSQTVTYNSGSASATAITLSLSGGTAASVAVASGASHGTATASGTAISYTPTAHYVGSDSFTYTATNTGGTSAPATVTLTVSGPTITLAPASLPSATANAAYSQTLSASGGFAPYSFSVTSGTLPAGLTLSSGGILSGTPTSNGSFTFTVTATDSGTGTSASGAHSYSLTVNALVLPPPVATNSAQTVPYNNGGASGALIPLSLSGGTPTSVTVVMQPAHGTLTIVGTSIRYVPKANYVGTDLFTYTATNAGGTSAPAIVTIDITAPPLTSTPTAPNTTVTQYSASAPFTPMTVTGGAQPLTYTVSPSLPQGLTLNSTTGQISGTPTGAVGSTTYTITATDAVGQKVALQFKIAVTAPPVTLSITPATLPAARVGSAYDASLHASGGTGPYTFALSSGAMPAGMTLASNGLLSGKPTSGGIGANFSIRATDANGATGTATYSFTVNVRPNPTADPSVTGEMTAQAMMAKHFVVGQIDNVTNHLDALRGAFDACADLGSIALNAQDPGGEPNSIQLAKRVGTSMPTAPENLPTPKTAAPDGNDKCLNKALFESGNLGFWMGGSIGRGAFDTPGSYRSYFSSSGLTFGFDAKISDRLLVGAAVGGGWDQTRIDQSGSEIDGRSASGEFYAILHPTNWLAVSGLLGYGQFASSNARYVSDDDVVVHGDRSGSNLFASFRLAGLIEYTAFRFEPYLRADFIDSRMGTYQELGSSDLALTYDSAHNDSQTLAAGFSMLREFGIGPKYLLTPLFGLEQQHSLNSNQTQILYYSDQGSDSSYSFNATALPESLTRATVGLRASSRGGFSCEAGMTYEAGSSSYVIRTYRLSAHGNL